MGVSLYRSFTLEITIPISSLSILRAGLPYKVPLNCLENGLYFFLLGFFILIIFCVDPMFSE